MKLLIILMLLLNSLLIADDNLNRLDKDISETIRSACHGYLIDMIPDTLSHGREWLNQNSPVCKEIQENNNVTEALRRHRYTLTQEDFDFIYKHRNAPDPENQILSECQAEFMCLKVRKKLQVDGVPATQQQYSQVVAYCKNKLSPYECIENWFSDEWTRKGTRVTPSPQKYKQAGLDFEDLMLDTSPSQSKQSANIKENKTLGMDELMGGGRNNNSQKVSINIMDTGTSDKQRKMNGEVGFDNIYEGRQLVEVDNLNKQLSAQNEKISQLCDCSFRTNSCFKMESYEHEQLNTMMVEANENYEGHKESVCESWANDLRGQQSDNKNEVEYYLGNSEVILGNLSKIDNGYAEIIVKLDDKQDEIIRAIKQQQALAQKKKNSNLFGKLLTLGAVAGLAGSADLAADQMAQVLTSTAADLFQGDGTASNLTGLLNNLQLDSLKNPPKSQEFSKFNSSIQDSLTQQQRQFKQELKSQSKQRNIDDIFQSTSDEPSNNQFCKPHCGINNCGSAGCEGCGFFGCRGMYGTVKKFNGAKCGPDGTVIEGTKDGNMKLGDKC